MEITTEPELGNGVQNGNAVIERECTETDPLKQDNVEIKKRTKRETIRNVFNNITVEPCVLMFIVAAITTMVTSQNLTLDKACRVNLNYSDEICTALRLQNTTGIDSTYELNAQKLVSSLMGYKSIITAIVPSVIALFIGFWSDLTGHRKVFILIPVCGQVLICISNTLNVIFFYQLPLEVLIFTEAVIEGITGSWCILLMVVFSYISNITTNEERTFRMGMVSFALTVGFPIGMSLSGVLIKKFGYFSGFSFSIAVHSANLLYTILVLKDPPRSDEQRKHDRRGVKHFFKTFFNLSNVKHTWGVVFGGPRKRVIRMIVMLIIVSLLFGPFYGEMSILYMSTRYRFGWDEVQFSMFQTYNFITHTVGTIFSLTVLSKYWQWHDSVLGIISTVSKIAASFIYCFARDARIFYLAPMVEILNGTSLLAMRSISSKIVAPDELGKLNSIFSLTENLMPLVYVPLYTRVYIATIDELPGAVFLVGASMTLPAVVVFVYLFIEHRLNNKTNEPQIKNSEEEQL